MIQPGQRVPHQPIIAANANTMLVLPACGRKGPEQIPDRRIAHRGGRRYAGEMLKLAHALLALLAAPALAQPQAAPLTPAETGQIDRIVTRTLAADNIPSAEVAVVRGGRIVLNQAYGKANEGLPARPDLPYQIASNSKQFTAMALLLLEDEGKLSLDDPVSKYIPGITEGDRTAVRQLLSHTAGVQDFWPQTTVSRRCRIRLRRRASSTAGQRSRSTSSPASNGNIRTPAT